MAVALKSNVRFLQADDGLGLQISSTAVYGQLLQKTFFPYKQRLNVSHCQIIAKASQSIWLYRFSMSESAQLE